jgi:phage shock protein A
MVSNEVLDIRSRLTELRRLLAASMTDEQRLYQRQADANREAERWRQRAELAAGKGADDLTRAALERAARHEARASELRLEFLWQKAHVEEMKSRLFGLETRIRAVPSRLAPPVDTGRLERTLSRLQRQEEQARDERARLVAFVELERDEVAEKLAVLERETLIEQQLSELKRRLSAG